MEKELRVLIVDDNPVNLLAAKNMLSQFALKLAEARSGLEALQYVQMNEVDLIIMDLIMPGLSGIETIQRIRTQVVNGNQIKIIATSGQKIDNLTVFLKENLIDDYLMKPLDLKRVEQCFAQWFLLTKNKLSELDSVEQEEEWNRILTYFGSIEQLDFKKAEHTTGGNSEYFLRIIRSSILQLRESGITYHSMLNQFTIQKAHQLLHALKSVLYYLCATKLAAWTERLDEAFLIEEDNLSHCNSMVQSLQELHQLIQTISKLSNELEQASIAYNNSINKHLNSVKSQQYSKKEICNQIESLLSCVCRFEYIEILKGIKKLMVILPTEYIKYIDVARKAMDEFDYETVKNVLVACWNDMNTMKEI